MEDDDFYLTVACKESRHLKCSSEIKCKCGCHKTDGKGLMPLNIASVLWLSGSATEVNNFIKNAELKHNAVLLGHKHNIRPLLLKITKWDNLENLQPLITQSREQAMEATFLLIQGSIIGLLVTEETK